MFSSVISDRSPWRRVILGLLSLLLLVCLCDTVPRSMAISHHRALDLISRSLLQTRAGGGNVEFTTKWFAQRLDHLGEPPQLTRTFQQRYYVSTDLCVGGCQAAVIYIGGEAELLGSKLVDGQHVEIARQHNAAIFGLEHRYYGASQPFPEWTTENLQYLSENQALQDLATFIESVIWNEHPQSRYYTVCVGGSYPGSLSAWLRLKYPHIVTAALASSAPILAKADFYEYDQQVQDSAGKECANSLAAAMLEVNKTIINPQQFLETRRLFNCTEVQDQVSFLYVIADVVSFAIQYTSTRKSAGFRYMMKDRLCTTMESGGMDSLASFVTWLFDKGQMTSADFDLLAPQNMNTTWVASRNLRQWMYQSCTSFGYFQTSVPSTVGPTMRPAAVDLNYFFGVCDRLFSQTIRPRINGTNIEFGGQQPRGTRIVFTNGSLDPWHRLSYVTNSTVDPTQIALYIQGTSHCADLYPASPQDDPPSLVSARLSTLDDISQWMSNPSLCTCVDCASPCMSPFCSIGPVVGLAVGVFVGGGLLGLLIGYFVTRNRNKDFIRVN